MISVILDLLVIAIIVLSIIVAYKKGFVRTLFSLLGGVLALVLAISFSAPVANWVNSSFVGPAVRSSILSAIIEEPMEQGYEESLATVDVSGKLIEMPDSLRTFLESVRIDPDQASQEAQNNRGTTVTARDQLLAKISDPISLSISKVVAIIGLAIVFFILLFFASLLLSAVFKLLPFGRSLNRVGGIALGIVRAGLFACIFGAVAFALASFNTWVSFEEIEGTFLLKYINQVNPILNYLA